MYYQYNISLFSNMHTFFSNYESTSKLTVFSYRCFLMNTTTTNFVNDTFLFHPLNLWISSGLQKRCFDTDCTWRDQEKKVEFEGKRITCMGKTDLKFQGEGWGVSGNFWRISGESPENHRVTWSGKGGIMKRQIKFLTINLQVGKLSYDHGGSTHWMSTAV